MTTTTTETYLSLSWSVSRGRDTYGYNICRLEDVATGKRYRCNGGGYDMTGTVVGDWLQATYADELAKLTAHHVYTLDAAGKRTVTVDDQGLYGLSFVVRPAGMTVSVDGACGLSSVERIAEAIGLRMRHTVDRRGHVTGIMVMGAP